MKTIVKIISCTGPYDWYKDKIGEQFELRFLDKHQDLNQDFNDKIDTEFTKKHVDFVVDRHLSTGELGSIYSGDAELIEVSDDFIVRDEELVPTEYDMLKEELAITQDALNEIIMNQLMIL